VSKPLHIWITGAGRGIGAAIARTIAAGNHCTVSGRNRESLDALASEFPPGNIAVAPCDVSDHSSVLAAHATAVTAFGPVNVLVNNAGIASFRPFVETTPEAFDEQIAVNLRGVYSCCSAVVPAMIEQQAGMIVTINSIAARTTFSSCSAYGASKAGALALTQVLRAELREYGIKVCDVLVGATDTDIWAKDMRQEHGHRMLHGSDVAQAVSMIIDSYSNPRLLFEELTVRPQLGDL
jgi:NAD(P)-dependent dehydrogenase (short-subunit alcohol dehydrogenase family)